MFSADISNKIISKISEISGIEEEEITPDKHLFKDLEIDSIKAIEITVAIEKMFKVSVRDEEVPNITTVQQAIDLTQKLMKEKKGE